MFLILFPGRLKYRQVRIHRGRGPHFSKAEWFTLASVRQCQRCLTRLLSSQEPRGGLLPRLPYPGSPLRQSCHWKEDQSQGPAVSPFASDLHGKAFGAAAEMWKRRHLRCSPTSSPKRQFLSLKTSVANTLKMRRKQEGVTRIAEPCVKLVTGVFERVFWTVLWLNRFLWKGYHVVSPSCCSYISFWSMHWRSACRHTGSVLRLRSFRKWSRC